MKQNYSKNIAIIIPMANEALTFEIFTSRLIKVLDLIVNVTVYIVLDKASKDRTLELFKILVSTDLRFKVVFSPENRNVVDAYIRGYKEAYIRGHDWVIEMDAGLSHEPESLPVFFSLLDKEYDCVYGSRFVEGGRMMSCSLKRKLLSKYGTRISNLLLGTNYSDMTSGFQGFQRGVVEKLLKFELKSEAHFYQTELKYLLREYKYIETPIIYSSPSPNVSFKSISNSIQVLFYYFTKRIVDKIKK